MYDSRSLANGSPQSPQSLKDVVSTISLRNKVIHPYDRLDILKSSDKQTIESIHHHRSRCSEGWYLSSLLLVNVLIRALTSVQLSREDEAGIGKEDLEVRREDQDKINSFSRLHQREMLLEEDLKSKAVPPRPRFSNLQLGNNDFAERERRFGRAVK